MRLTKKSADYYLNKYEPILSENHTEEEVGKAVIQTFDKLGQLEDIEEELGIDLITLFKALKDGIYHKKYHCPYPYSLIPVWTTGGIKFHIVADSKKIDVKLKDYGKDWALTKEELENENTRKN